MRTPSDDLTWRRSSFCANGSCAEVAVDGDVVHLRNSRHPEHVIRLDRDEWAALKAAIVNGEF